MRPKLVMISLFVISIMISAFPSSIHLNQVGFYPLSQKIAIVVGAESDSFYIINSKKKVAFKGILQSEKYWDASGEKVRRAEFTSIKETGEYRIQIKGCPDSYVFRISSNVLQDVIKSSVKSFYFNRASSKLDTLYAGKWARNSGHPDTAALIHPSAATDSVPSGSKYSAPGGWYDAGDFGKYIVNSGISVYTLFAAYEAFPDFFNRLKVSIPESTNKIPDILDEVVWNLNWMLTMQDKHDGGVYNKITAARFCGFIMPESDTGTRFIMPKSVTATLNFAAVMAQAHRVLKKFDAELPGLSQICLIASLKAWDWARKNPTQFYNQKEINVTFDPDVVTGEYNEGNGTGLDEFQWAATELYIATKQDSFFTIAYPENRFIATLTGWQSVGTLGLYSLALCKDSLTPIFKRDSVVNALKKAALEYVKISDSSAYGIVMQKGDYYWGSNAVAANQGILLMMAYLATGEHAFKRVAIDQVDYLLGRNPNGICFVTGNGSRPPREIHHRVSVADSIKEIVPGFLVGGPNAAQQDSIHCKDCYISKLPALSYSESYHSYASNEVAINWSAPMVFLTGAVEALQTTKK